MLNILKNVSESIIKEIQEEMSVRKTKELFLMFAMGSQFDHLIVQNLERLGVFCLVADPVSVTAEDVEKLAPIGIILSGGPSSVHTKAPQFDSKIFDLGIPLLGICLGFQMWAKHLGAEVVQAEHSEFGRHPIKVIGSTALFEDITEDFIVLQSHGDCVLHSKGFSIIASTGNAKISASYYKHLWGVQFHPEVSDTQHGEKIFENFCFGICKAKDKFPALNVAMRKIEEIQKTVDDGYVLLAISGGSDSATVAYLLKKAFLCGQCRIRGIYIRGIDRPDDEKFVLEYFGSELWIDLEIIDATDQFLEVLTGKITMKDKRIAMRGVYKKVLEEEAQKLSKASGKKVFIAQGTLYTDISESGHGYSSGAKKAKIKLHHNVKLDLSFPELLPLSDCVKDGGRNIGRSIGVPEELLTRHPFPGPGLVVRIEGEITHDNLVIARAIDDIYIEELRKWNLYNSVWQAGAVVTQSITTCTKGDGDSDGFIVALWAVWSVNGFTAQRARLSDDFLDHVSQRITNEVRSVGGVVYRISGKPPTTIEWG